MGSSGKERLKWTDELHQLFEMAVSKLGGPDRATPKGILKAMEVQGLAIFHVKSHLQKYRMSKLAPESSIISSRDKYEKRRVSEILPNFGTASGVQLDQALQLYKQVQKHMSDQTEVQRSLKKNIESQGRFLDMIKGQPLISKPDKVYSSMSLPLICDEPDLVTEKNKMGFEEEEEEEEEESQAAKRLKKMENEMSKQCESMSSFSWTTEFSSASQSPLFYPFTDE